MLAWRHASHLGFAISGSPDESAIECGDGRGQSAEKPENFWSSWYILVFLLKIRVGKKVKIWLEPQARWVRWSQGAPPPAPASPAPPSSTPSTGWALLSAAPEPAWCSCPPGFRKDSWTVVLFGWLSKWFLGSGHFAEILTGSIDEFKIFQKDYWELMFTS